MDADCEILKYLDGKIYSVKRLNDSMIFSLGDRIKALGRISEFEVCDDLGMWVHAPSEFSPEAGSWIKHIKIFEVPFETIDGISIDEYTQIFEFCRLRMCILTGKNIDEYSAFRGYPCQNSLLFSTREAAEQYILKYHPEFKGLVRC